MCAKRLNGTGKWDKWTLKTHYAMVGDNTSTRREVVENEGTYELAHNVRQTEVTANVIYDCANDKD